MNSSALPYQSLMTLNEMSPDVAADLRVLDALVTYAYDHDTGGLVAYDVAEQFVSSRGALDRLNACDLLHHHFDIVWCGCHAPKSAWHWSIHDFRHLSARPTRRHDVVAAS
jgi:hypothetical protein